MRELLCKVGIWKSWVDYIATEDEKVQERIYLGVYESPS
jgi:hypothetical protein